MDRKELETLVMQTIAASMGLRNEEVELHNKLSEDLGGDSLDLIEIAMDLENELNIEIPDDVLETDDQDMTIVKLVDIVEQQIAAAA